MAAIRKSNLRGKKRWLGRNSTPQETGFRGYRAKDDTNLPPLPKPAPEFLNRRKGTTPSFWSKSCSSIVSSSPSVKVKPQRANKKSSQKRNHKAIPLMPDGSKVPTWLMRWNSFHRHTAVITFLLVSTTLIVYGWTVYSQHLWSRSYKELQDLQRDERQLTKHDETLKNKMAQEAQKPHSGLVSPTPANTIFLLEENTPSSSRKVDREILETKPQPSHAPGY
ncbi:MAG: hypothetical protein MJK14_06120 [Rivularia sp. ALOHA_DT_140]|nr:hypothetical protein [Rivularia sp. ALOHA_DT_140]